MTSRAKQLLKAALQLAPREREALACQLFESLQTEGVNAEAAWQAETEKRIKELDGTVKPIPWAKARRVIFGDACD